jgi:hypothetical protein
VQIVRDLGGNKGRCGVKLITSIYAFAAWCLRTRAVLPVLNIVSLNHKNNNNNLLKSLAVARSPVTGNNKK